jgi:hypothetical protein
MRVTIAAAAIVSTLLLAGCSLKDDIDPAPRTAPTTAPATAAPSASAAAAPDPREIANSYATLRQMTTEPVQVGRGMIAMCAPAAPAGAAPDKTARYGPHADGSIRIFMNDLAADAFAKPARPFPVRSVIVKEKQPREFGVGGMIKRPAGYDPDHGDWEYFYFDDDPAKLESGKLTSCAQCHHRAAGKDYVFGDWSARSRK